jgi:hypothetical protein
LNDFPFWSPDGRSIGFFAEGRLKRVDISGGQPVVLAEAPVGAALKAVEPFGLR